MPAILGVHAHAMHTTVQVFMRSENGGWLVDAVPRPFLEYPITIAGDDHGFDAGLTDG